MSDLEGRLLDLHLSQGKRNVASGQLRKAFPHPHWGPEPGKSQIPGLSKRPNRQNEDASRGSVMPR